MQNFIKFGARVFGQSRATNNKTKDLTSDNSQQNRLTLAIKVVEEKMQLHSHPIIYFQ